MRALILVDIQNDFVTGGALEVPGGEEVVPVANRLQREFELVVATQDWHPPDHASFAANHDDCEVGEVFELDGLEQILWPVHCVQNTPGAEFVSELETGNIARVFQKGTDPRVDSYSGFYDNGHRRSTGMGEWLNAQQVDEVFLLGLATDYCVKFTALDARRFGFRTQLVEDGCRGVEMNAGDCEAALRELRDAGVKVADSHSV